MFASKFYLTVFLLIASFITYGQDIDQDGVPDVTDNCKYTFNPSQADCDGDGIGDACDCSFCGANPVEAHQPSIAIAASPGTTIAIGTNVTFTAYTESEGTSPIYEWSVNGVITGSNSPTFNSATLNDGDVVTCTLTSNVSCAAGNVRTSNSLTIVASTLPVTLKAFEGEYRKNSFLLNWTIETPTNFSHFNIERSEDGVYFSSIGNIIAGLNNVYHFTDSLLANSKRIFYYRLKMVDFNGKYNYSKIIQLRTDGKANSFLLVPNPVANQLNLYGLNKNGWLKIFDLTGKELLRNPVAAADMSIDVLKLHSGLYILQYFDGTEMQITKFFKK